MKEIFDIIVWGGIIYILFILIRGMNEQQIQKHDAAIKRNEERKNKSDEKAKLEGTNKND